MSVTLTIEAATLHDLMDQLALTSVRAVEGRQGVTGSVSASAEPQEPVEAPEQGGKRKRRTKAEMEAERAGALTQPEPEQPEQPKAMEGFATPTDIEGLRNILRTVAQTKSPQAAAGILTAMQYTKVSDVPKEKYVEFAAIADKAMA